LAEWPGTALNPSARRGALRRCETRFVEVFVRTLKHRADAILDLRCRGLGHPEPA
jgi:hypothetical protein